MPWIKTIAYEDASGRLKKLYDRVKGRDNNVDNIMMVHSLRPHTMEGHMSIYKYVLHHTNNEIPKWFLETLGVWVSALNNCTYCVEHHFAGLMRLLADDEEKAEGMGIHTLRHKSVAWASLWLITPSSTQPSSRQYSKRSTAMSSWLESTQSNSSRA